MNDLSLIETLASCTDPCGWCIHQCPDHDKYEMLVTCLRVQKGFLIVSQTVNKILAGRSRGAMEKILMLFEILADNLQGEHIQINKISFNAEHKPENVWRLPGCSQILLVAQTLEQIYLNETINRD
jgi:hypothetical protein